MVLFAVLPAPARAQQVVGTVSLTAEAGYLTNTYLHPVLPMWVPAEAPFLGLAPQASLAWSGDRTYAALEGGLRLTELTDRSGVWWMGTSQGRLYRSLSRSLGVGFDGAASRIRMGVHQWLAWGGPYAAARLGGSTQLTVRSGLSYRHYDADAAETSSAQHSYFAVAQLSTAADRWDFGAHLYGSRSPDGVTRAAGVGGRAVYLWSHRLSLGGEAGAERFGPETTMWQGAAYLEGTVTNAVSWSARLGVQRFTGGTDTTPDVFASLGLTYRLQRRRTAKPPRPALWTERGDDVILRFDYDGEGDLYLVGDFNDWRTGDLALRTGAGSIYTTRLSLEPGTYEYKILAVEDGAQRWLPLPEHTLTTDDGFGGTNGILLVE